MNTKINIEDINLHITYALQNYVGLKNDETARKLMVDTITQYIGSPDVKIGKCQPLWNTMTFKDKFIWWISNSIFPTVGETIRKYRLRSLANDSQDSDTLPSWANAEPKNVLVTDVYITPATPLKYIKLDFEVK